AYPGAEKPTAYPCGLFKDVLVEAVHNLDTLIGCEHDIRVLGSDSIHFASDEQAIQPRSCEAIGKVKRTTSACTAASTTKNPPGQVFKPLNPRGPPSSSRGS